jgi:phage shock protein A
MSIWKRIARIFGSRKNGEAGDVDALRETLDSSYRTQRELLQRVRRGVADVATSGKRIEIQIAQLRQQAARLDETARASVACGDDEAARDSLTRKVTLHKTIDRLETQRGELSAQEGKLQDSAQEIEAKIEQFRIRKDTLAARQTAAEARSEINTATTGISSQMGGVGRVLDEAERRTRELEAHADAVDELVKDGVIAGPGGDEHSTASFDRQFDALTSDADVDEQLEALKAGLPAGDGHGQDTL